MYKRTGFSISGVRNYAIARVPVPHNFQSIYEYLSNHNQIDIRYIDFPAGYIGEQFKPIGNKVVNEDVFSNMEMNVLNEVAATFEKTSTQEMVELSHLEEAWKKHEETKEPISYNYAFDLMQV